MPLGDSPTTHAGTLKLNSAIARELTFMVAPNPSTRAKFSGIDVVTSTWEAFCPSPVGDDTTAATTLLESKPFNSTRFIAQLCATELSESHCPERAAPIADTSATR